MTRSEACKVKIKRHPYRSNAYTVHAGPFGGGICGTIIRKREGWWVGQLISEAQCSFTTRQEAADWIVENA